MTWVWIVIMALLVLGITGFAIFILKMLNVAKVDITDEGEVTRWFYKYGAMEHMLSIWRWYYCDRAPKQHEMIISKYQWGASFRGALGGNVRLVEGAGRGLRGGDRVTLYVGDGKAANFFIYHIIYQSDGVKFWAYVDQIQSKDGED